MCGRFINTTSSKSLKKIFDSNSVINKELISYNIAPYQESLIIFKKNIIHIEKAKWGYIFFDKKLNLEKNIINSRLETIKR